MTIIAYSEARDLIRVGDVIGCRGLDFGGRVIRRVSAGEGDLSHISTIIRDTTNEAIGRVEILEALGDRQGMQRNPLSEAYARDHGDLFWFRNHMTDVQRNQIMRLGAEIRDSKIKYDFRSTILALFQPIFIDIKKFNCSESVWYLLTRGGVFPKRYDKKGREIAPTPSQFEEWSGVDPVHLDMLA